MHSASSITPTPECSSSSSENSKLGFAQTMYFGISETYLRAVSSRSTRGSQSAISSSMYAFCFPKELKLDEPLQACFEKPLNN